MIALLVAASLVCAQPVRVIDGDTIDVCNLNGTERIRIANLDAPESYRPACAKEKLAGIAAKEEALKFFVRPSVILDITRYSTDRYGRSIAAISVNGVDYAKHMIESGHGVKWQFNERHDWCKE
jgi:endonuclease YncB( thermonuclease family)